MKETDEASVEMLGQVIYEVVLFQLMQYPERDAFIPEGENREQVDFEQQREEYRTKVECFSINNVDRFFAVKRLAETNVVAANDLAGIYYHGNQYISYDEAGGRHGIYRVEADWKLAVRYLKKAVSYEPMMPDACWALGDMIWKKRFVDVSEEHREELALRYFSYAMERDFIPAYNSVGIVELSRGDRLLAQSEALNVQGTSETDWAEMIYHYCRGLELCDKAGCMGWVYGHINVANFLANERYARRVWPEVREIVKLKGPVNLRKRWKAAADMGSLWAMNKLAFLDWKQNWIQSAVEIWEQASESHFPAASLNLAQYIYGQDCPKADKQQYRMYLERASADGSADASYKLALLYRESNPSVAKMLLSRAEEQKNNKFHEEKLIFGEAFL